MPKIKFKKILINLIIILAIFFTDRMSKIYILELAEFGGNVDVYLNSYLNLYLIWNKGIFISLGVLCLILAEVFFNKEKKNEIK